MNQKVSERYRQKIPAGQLLSARSFVVPTISGGSPHKVIPDVQDTYKRLSEILQKDSDDTKDNTIKMFIDEVGYVEFIRLLDQYLMEEAEYSQFLQDQILEQIPFVESFNLESESLANDVVAALQSISTPSIKVFINKQIANCIAHHGHAEEAIIRNYYATLDAEAENSRLDKIHLVVDDLKDSYVNTRIFQDKNLTYTLIKRIKAASKPTVAWEFSWRGVGTLFATLLYGITLTAIDVRPKNPPELTKERAYNLICNALSGFQAGGDLSNLLKTVRVVARNFVFAADEVTKLKDLICEPKFTNGARKTLISQFGDNTKENLLAAIPKSQMDNNTRKELSVAVETKEQAIDNFYYALADVLDQAYFKSANAKDKAGILGNILSRPITSRSRCDELYKDFELTPAQLSEIVGKIKILNLSPEEQQMFGDLLAYTDGVRKQIELALNIDFDKDNHVVTTQLEAVNPKSILSSPLESTIVNVTPSSSISSTVADNAESDLVMPDNSSFAAGEERVEDVMPTLGSLPSLDESINSIVTTEHNSPVSKTVTPEPISFLAADHFFDAGLLSTPNVDTGFLDNGDHSSELESPQPFLTGEESYWQAHPEHRRSSSTTARTKENFSDQQTKRRDGISAVNRIAFFQQSRNNSEQQRESVAANRMAKTN